MTDLTNPRATVSALLHDVHVLMANMQTAADKLQHWLNATADLPVAALPAAPVLPAPLPAPVPVAAAPAPAPAPAKRGRKPKEKHPVLEALTRMAKGWKGSQELFDTVVLVTPSGIRSLPAAKVCWDIPCNTGLPAGQRAAVSGRELLDTMKRAGAGAQLTASADTHTLQVDGDVVVRLRSQGTYTAEAWDEQAPHLEHRPPAKVIERGQWTRATLDAICKVARVASTDQTRTAIQHVLLAGPQAVATDGHRLEVQPAEHTGKHLLIPGYLAPVLATFTDAEVNWERGLTHTRVIDADGVSMMFAHGDEVFPDWKRVMPRADAKVFALSVERSVLAQRSKAKSTGLPYWTCTLRDDGLHIEERGQDGSTTFTLPVTVMSRPDGDKCLPPFGLNWQYVNEMCEGDDSHYVTLFVEDQFAPILCSRSIYYDYALDMVGGAPVQIIMPVRI